MTAINEEDRQRENRDRLMSRRGFLVSGFVLASTAVLAACGIQWGGSKEIKNENNLPRNTESAASSPTGGLEPTPACGEVGEATLAVTEGPYYTPDSPERISLLQSGLEGTMLTITGYVLTTGCQPIKHALLDFWQADANGEYDNKGYTLRGHQFTDEKGKFTLTTVVPGLYPGRTRHIHVKAQAPDKDILTTQLFFPGEPGNSGDGIYHDALLMNVRENAEGSKSASFNFVLSV